MYPGNSSAYEAAKVARIRANARVGRRKRWLEEDASRAELIVFLNGPAAERSDFLFKMQESLAEWGSLTEKQEAAVRRCQAGNAERDAKRAAESAAAAPVPVTDDRMTVEGTILTIKEKMGRFGLQVKMLVKHDTGYKLWGTMPASLAAGSGDKVRFEAKVEPSRDDPKFGFFSRPTKSEVLERKETENAVA